MSLKIDMDIDWEVVLKKVYSWIVSIVEELMKIGK